MPHRNNGAELSSVILLTHPSPPGLTPPSSIASASHSTDPFDVTRVMPGCHKEFFRTLHWDVVVARLSSLSMNLQELNLLAKSPTIQLMNWLQARNLLSARLRCAPCMVQHPPTALKLQESRRNDWQHCRWPGERPTVRRLFWCSCCRNFQVALKMRFEIPGRCSLYFSFYFWYIFRLFVNVGKVGVWSN